MVEGLNRNIHSYPGVCVNRHQKISFIFLIYAEFYEQHRRTLKNLRYNVLW